MTIKYWICISNYHTKLKLLMSFMDHFMSHSLKTTISITPCIKCPFWKSASISYHSDGMSRLRRVCDPSIRHWRSSSQRYYKTVLSAKSTRSQHHPGTLPQGPLRSMTPASTSQRSILTPHRPPGPHIFPSWYCISYHWLRPSLWQSYLIGSYFHQPRT